VRARLFERARRGQTAVRRRSVQRIVSEALGARSLERLDRDVKPAERRAEILARSQRATHAGVAGSGRIGRNRSARLAVSLHAGEGAIE